MSGPDVSLTASKEPLWIGVMAWPDSGETVGLLPITQLDGWPGNVNWLSVSQPDSVPVSKLPLTTVAPMAAGAIRPNIAAAIPMIRLTRSSLRIALSRFT